MILLYVICLDKRYGFIFLPCINDLLAYPLPPFSYRFNRNYFPLSSYSVTCYSISITTICHYYTTTIIYLSYTHLSYPILLLFYLIRVVNVVLIAIYWWKKGIPLTILTPFALANLHSLKNLIQSQLIIIILFPVCIYV